MQAPQLMRPPTYMELRGRLEQLGHEWFGGAWNPNVLGIRNRSRRAGAWDDLLLLAYEDDHGAGHVHAYAGTTDPGQPWLQGDGVEPHPDGTAIVLPQQARGCWQVGADKLHRGKYPAFVQVAPMYYVRDNNGDGVLDIERASMAGGELRGVRGLNGHRASAYNAASTVGLYSAGCQVWRLPHDFDHALGFVTWAAQWYGDRVTYTLLDQWLGV